MGLRGSTATVAELRMMMDSGSETLNGGGSMRLGPSPGSSPQPRARSVTEPPPPSPHAEPLQEPSPSQTQPLQEPSPSHVEPSQEPSPSHPEPLRESPPPHAQSIQESPPPHARSIHEPSRPHARSIQEPPPLPPPPHRPLPPSRQDECGIASIEQLIMGFDESASHDALWHEMGYAPKSSADERSLLHPDVDADASPRNQSPTTERSTSFHQSPSSVSKRRSYDIQSRILELETKRARMYGSLEGNGCHGIWSTQVEDLAEHLAVDFEEPLSALPASDFASTVASYDMRENLLVLPSLTVLPQDASSPNNRADSAKGLNSSRRSDEADSNNNDNVNAQARNGVTSNVNDGNATTRMTDVESPARGSTVNAGVNQRSNDNNDQGTRNNEETEPSLHELLCSDGEDYQLGTFGNYVSFSQQGNGFNENSRFQYVLAAATSIATKLNEETLTYLNQGQPYKIKLKKLGDLSAYRDKILKSSIKICFHEKRLQYTEREQMIAWQRTHPGERLLEVDVALSYGMIDVSQTSPSKNSVEFMWDPTKEVGAYIKVNCISTEFTPRKHGGEKGTPFRIHVETRLPGGSRLHAASCQVKVFKLKGADRKHKQDRDKIQRRLPREPNMYQPSYDCTVLSDMQPESLSPPNPISQSEENPFATSDSVTIQNRSTVGASPVAPSITLSPIGQFITAFDPFEEEAGTDASATVDATANIETTTPRTTGESLSSSCGVTGGPATEPTSNFDPRDGDVADLELPVDANVSQTNAWLQARRFQSFRATFASFAAGDILRLSRNDLIQICGLADGIRLFNALHWKAPRPKLTLYFAVDGNAASPWTAIYLENLSGALLATKLLALLNMSRERLHSVLVQGPQGVHVLVSNELVANIKDESMYLVEVIKDGASERYKLLLKPSLRR